MPNYKDSFKEKELKLKFAEKEKLTAKQEP